MPFDPRRWLARGLIVFVHALLEAFDSLTEITHHFGNAAAPEQDEDDEGYDDQLPGTKAPGISLKRVSSCNIGGA